MSDKSLRERAEMGFGLLLKWHLFKNGTRPNKVRVQWKKSEFASKLYYRSGNTVSNWILEKHLPPTVEDIAIGLLGDKSGDDSTYAEYRSQLRTKFAEAKSKTKRENKPDEIGSKPNVKALGKAQVYIAEAISHYQPTNLPYPSLGKLFKGRNATLQQIQDRLFSSEDESRSVATCAICGLGGVGKTRVAIEYAFRYRERYSALLFLRANTASNLRSDFAAMVSPLIINLPEAGATNDDVKISAVLRWLNVHPNWLLIFDNVDDPEAMSAAQGWLAKLNGGHVLLNGRRSVIPASIPKLDELGALDHTASLEFMFGRTGQDRARRDDDDEHANALVTELGGLALGLEQAGAYIATERISFSRYMELWREKRKVVIEWFDRELMAYDHDSGLAATWATSFDRLSPDSRWLLERLSYFGPDPIPNSVFDVFDEDDGPSVAMHSAKSGLFSYSLISVAQVKEGRQFWEGFAVHRLVQDFTRRGMGDVASGEAIFQSASWILNAFSGDPSDTRTWPKLEPIVPHMQALVNFPNERCPELIGFLYYRLGAFFRAKGRHSEAEPALLQSLKIMRSANNGDARSLAAAISNFAEFQFVMNRLDKAEELYEEAQIVFHSLSVEEDPKAFVSFLNNYSELLRRTSRQERAIELTKQSYEIANQYLDKDDPKLIRTIISFASLLISTDELAHAEQLCRHAVKLTASCEKLKQDCARSSYMLANVLRAMGRGHFSESEKYYNESIALAVECYSQDHPLVAVIIRDYVLLLRASNRHPEAEPLMRLALSIHSNHFPTDHPNVVDATMTLQRLLRDLGRDEEADEL